ncbi:hypothetical protein [Nostoc sp.]|uniref:hypothetical protein n=1 Tax=Nostoc sp. TaxID=1180 RepID=UPI002FF65531
MSAKSYHVRLNNCHCVRPWHSRSRSVSEGEGYEVEGSNPKSLAIASFHFVALAMTYHK